MRRVHSLPPWETLKEPADSEDAEDEADEDDELASISGSHISHPPAASSGNIGIRSAASTLPDSREVATDVRLSRQSGLGTRAPFATPQKTQSAQKSGSILGTHGTMGQKKELLAKLTTQGRRQSGQSPGTSGRASGSGISSPSREDAPMSPPPNPSPNQTQSQDMLRTGKERATGFSARQPVASSLRSVLSSSISTPGSSRIWTLVPAISTADFDKNKSEVIPQSDTKGSSIDPPIWDNTSGRTLSQTLLSSSAGRPSTSQAQLRPRITNSLSAPEVTQASKGCDNSSSGKGKERRVIEIVESDEDMDAPGSQILPRPKPRKKAVDSVNKLPVISSSSQRRYSPLRDLSTSSGDELPSLSQIVSSPDKNRSPRKSFAISSPVRHRAGEEVLEEGESDNGPVSSISQADRRRTTHDWRNSLSSQISRDKSDKRKATSKSSSGSSSLPQNPKRKMDQDRNRRGTRIPPSTQPTSSSSSRPGPVLPPFSTQPTSASAAQPRPKLKNSNSSILTGFSPAKSSGNITRLGTVELSSDEDEARPMVNRRGTGLSYGDVIDLTLDDDGNAPPSTSTSLVQTGSPPRDASPKAVASIQLAQSLTITTHDSPPAVRPKPRVSVVPKEKVAPPKPQPAGLKLLDEGCRRSSAIGGKLEADNVSENDEPTPLGSTAERVEQNEASSTHQDPAAADPALVPAPDISLISHQEEPRFDIGGTEVMETAYMDMDEPGPPLEDYEPSAGVEMQIENNEFSPEQLEQRNPEETTAPIKRARELRSPSVAVQSKETQSQEEDANEVDLLLASSPLRTDAPGSIHSSDAAQLEKSDNMQHLQLAVLGPLETKSETLTDKLGMLDLSRAVATVGKDLCSDSDASMSDLEKVGDAEPPSAPQDAPIAQPHVVSIADDLPEATMKEMNSDEADAKSRATTSVAIPSSASTSGPGPAYLTSKVSSKVSGKPPSSTRAASPGALVAPPPMPGFMGFMGSAKRKRVDLSPGRDKSPTAGIGADEKARSRRDAKLISNKPEAVRVGGVDLTGSVSEPIEAQAPVKLPSDEHKRLSLPPTTSDNGILQLDDSLSPRSRARLRIPEVRPPRKPDMLALIPVSQSRMGTETETGKDRSSEAASPSVSMVPKESGPPHKEPGSVGAFTTSPSEAVASSRKLAQLIPGLLDSAISGTQKGTTPSSQKMATSSPKAKSYSVSFLRRQIEKAEMRIAPFSSPTRHNANEVSTPPGQSDSWGTSWVSSPKRSRSPHSVLDQKDETPASEPAVGASVVWPSASSEGVSAAIGARDSGDSAGSNEAPAHRTDKIPSINAAPSTNFYVARKTTLKRRPRVGISPSTPSQRSVEKRKESKISNPTSHFRKRILSTTPHPSSLGDGPSRIVEQNSSASKRPRITRSTDGEESSKTNVSVLRRSSRRTLGSSGGSSQIDSDASMSSADPMDVINEPLDVDGESSSDQPVTPVTGLAGAVGDIAITPVPSVAKHCREIDRYFLNRDRGPIWYHINDVPTELVNEVNDTPEWCRNPLLLRQIFEAAILQNTTEDEWASPHIQIINNIDDEPTPPFEFYYTNRIYHGNGVPPPEYRSLKGCMCVGRCDPRSNTCACIIRQRKFFEQQENNHQGFVYDDKGRVQIHEFPIFECNDACGCSEDCSNRVVQRGRKCHVNIVKTKNKGWGIFAGKKILSGTFIGIYSGEILLHEESVARGTIYNKIGRTYLFDIDFWYFAGSGNNEVVAKYTMDAFHVGNFTRFMNHSCQPNCTINAVYINEANIEKPLLGVFARQDINAGEELTFSYYGDLDEDDFKNPDGSEDQAYQACLCGAPKCVGKLFSFSGTGE